MKKIILLFSTIFIHLITYSQFTIDWQQSYGGMENEEAYDIVETDGGFFLGGVSSSTDGQITCATQNAFYWMLKIDYNGNILNQWCYNNYSVMRLLKAKGDNPYFYMVGDVYEGIKNLLVVKFNQNGDFLWEKSVGSSTGVFNYLIDGTATNDGGVVATSCIHAGGGDVTNYYGNWDGWITKFDSIGTLQWECTIGSSGYEDAICITELSDNGYLVGLHGSPNLDNGNIKCSAFSTDYTDIIIAKIDSTGNLQWCECLGGSNNEGISEIIEADNGYLIAGTTSSRDGDVLNGGLHGDFSKDIWLIKVDFSGNIIWQKCFGGTKTDYPHRLFRTTDNGFIIFASTDSWDCDLQGNIPHSNPSIWIFKIDSEGELQWQKCIQSTAREEIVNGVIIHSDNKFTLAGTMTHSPNYDVNCSNFDSGSRENFYVAGISITEVSTPERSLNENKFNIYPVPSNGTVTIEIPEQPEHDPFTIEFIDLKGIIRKSVTQPQSIGHYDISHLPPGMYMVRFKNRIGVVYKKVLLSR